MSGILGIFNNVGRPISDAELQPMVKQLRSRGAKNHVLHTEVGAALAVTRHNWELSAGLSGDVWVLEEGELIVAADASIYYRKELTAKLAAKGIPVTGDTPSHLVLAAYTAWGDRCAEQLEGDFAFIVYVRRTRSVLCSRDFQGRRSLFYAELGDTFIISSTVGAILAHPACPDELNLAAIGATAAGMLWSLGSDTCYAAIKVVPMAASLVWHGRTQIRKYWQPPPIGPNTGKIVTPSFDQAAEQLRELLAQAVSERLAPSGPSTVWMSGGWDSTAVFGAGQHVLRNEPRDRALLPVSISYPPGDLGREDELISAIAEFWDIPVHWLHIDDIPLFHRDAERAAVRDEPATSPYEMWNLALARGSRACGARIALDGNGGDQLFRASSIYLADLFRRGHWLTLARELRHKRLRPVRPVIDTVIKPALPVSLQLLLAGGHAPNHYLERPVPVWIRTDFVRRYGLVERERACLPPSRAKNLHAAELQWMATMPMAGYGLGVLWTSFLEFGLEVRSPLMDRRIVEFALARPRCERVSGRETKRLLRRAMHGLLPDHVLALRPTRTGVTVSYSRRWMRKAYPELFGELFRAPLVLAELGIIEPAQLRTALSEYLRTGGEFLRVGLFHTLQTELWLRSRLRTDRQEVKSPAPLLAVRAG